MIGTIAAVFHWPLSELIEMEIDELERWAVIAADRWQEMNRVEG